MSGPTVPFPEAHGIGEFVIGVDPIGVQQIPFNVWLTIIAQYANSTTLTNIILYIQAWLDQTTNFQSFYDLVWNIDTAVGHGLDVWGRILGVTRVVPIPAAPNRFGFDEALPGIVGWNQDAFYSGSGATQNFSLTDASYRTLLLAKALFNITDCSVPAINRVLLTLFPNRGNCYVTDNGGMSMTYVFTFPLTPAEFAIVTQSGVLPRPAGVLANFVTP